MPAEHVEILIVDDRTDLIAMFGEFLSSREEFAVEHVSSAKEGTELLSTRSFSLIISNDTGRDALSLEAVASSRDIPLVRVKNERRRSGSSKFTLQAGDTIVIEDSHQRMEFPVLGSSGLPALFLDLARNLQQLTKGRRARQGFAEAFGHPYDVISSAPVPICILSYPDIAWMNEEMAHILGYAPSSLVGRPFDSLLSLEGDRRWFGGLGRQSKTSVGWGQRDIALRKRDGESVPLRFKYRRTTGKEGVNMYICVCEDIRCQRLLLNLQRSFDQKVEEIETRYRAVLESMGAIVVRTDADGSIKYCNPAAEMVFGIRSEDAAGKNVIGTLVPAGSRSARDFMTMLSGCSGNADESSVIAVDHVLPGTKRACIAWKMVGVERDGTVFDIVCVGEDITDYSRPDRGGIRTDPWRTRLLKGTDIKRDVFDDVFSICVEISREGWEGKRVGTSFLVGDAPAVMARSQQLIINPFEAMEKDKRYVGNQENRNCIKNFAMLDGGFVIRGDGFIEASGRQFLPGDIPLDLPSGYGTRHRSVAAMTVVTGAVGIVVSETGGRLSVFRNGRSVKSLIF